MRIRSYLAASLSGLLFAGLPAFAAASGAAGHALPAQGAEKSESTDTSQLQGLIEQATALRLDGKADEAASLIQKALAKHPGWTEGYKERGNDLYALKVYALAVEDYCRVLKQNPKDKQTLIVRASARLWAGDVLGSIEDYSEVLKMDSACAEAYDNRAASYINLGEYENAIADFGKGIQSASLNKPELAAIHFHRGSTYWYQHKYKEALEDFTEVIKNGGDPSAYWNRALANFLLGNKQECLADITAFVDAKPAPPETEKSGEVPVNPFVKPSHSLLPAYLLRAILYFDLGQPAKGEEDFKTVLTLKDVPASFKLIAHAGLNDLKGAIDDLSQELSERNEYSTFLTRSDLYFRSKQFDKALCDAGAAISMKNAEAGGYCNRGEAYLGLKRYNDALNDLNKAITLAKENTVKGEALYWRGQAYKGMAKEELAQKDLAEAQKLGYDPELSIQRAYINMLIDGFRKQHDLPVAN